MKTGPSQNPTNLSPAETRNAKGEWRPPYPAKYAPLLVWPPKPRELILWFVNWPGFMWPVNAGLLVISIVTWL
ncbi:MAG: hypothetical protein WCS43_18085, partial [Verrucomicrobiota bacterium]